MSDKKLPPLRPRKPKVPPRIPDPKYPDPPKKKPKKKKSHINKVET